MLCKSLAEKDEADFLKFCWLDISAINNDFVRHFKNPENEPDVMHQACSKLHMQCWSTLFTHPEGIGSFDWNVMLDNADIELLSKIPPCVLTSSEFNHVG